MGAELRQQSHFPLSTITLDAKMKKINQLNRIEPADKTESKMFNDRYYAPPILADENFGH
uniref:Uncharacterized protein n=1 Tax=Romanomermis culicivorax TaxID=13658 RepID=A0A915HH20_ROMCU